MMGGCWKCGSLLQRIWTYRDSNVPASERYGGHGVEDVCAGCLYALTGTDYRDQSVGRVLSEIEKRCRRKGA